MFKKILIIRIGNIGDVLFVTPVIRKLRKTFERAQIDILTSPQGKIVVEKNPYLNNVFVYKKFHKIERWIKKRLLLDRLSFNGYDLCVVLESNLEYTKFAARVAKPALRIGVDSEFGKKFLHKTKEFSRSRHAIENYLDIVSKLLNIEISDSEYCMDFFFSGCEGLSREKGKDYFIVHSSCSSYLPSKSWEIDKFAQVAKYLINRGFSVFITGAASDAQPHLLLEKLKNEKNVHEFIGRHLNEVACLINQARGVFCLDTGILHIARALNKPLVCLFGPSDPQHTGPLGPGVYKTIRKDFSCGPCQYSSQYHQKEKEFCLDGKVTKCMSAIAAEEVMDAVSRIINEKNSNT